MCRNAVRVCLPDLITLFCWVNLQNQLSIIVYNWGDTPIKRGVQHTLNAYLWDNLKTLKRCQIIMWPWNKPKRSQTLNFGLSSSSNYLRLFILSNFYLQFPKKKSYLTITQNRLLWILNVNSRDSSDHRTSSFNLCLDRNHHHGAQVHQLVSSWDLFTAQHFRMFYLLSNSSGINQFTFGVSTIIIIFILLNVWVRCFLVNTQN